MGPQEKPQHAIRRSTRLPLEIPVHLSSLDDATPFSEQCQTTLVNAHGCGVISPRAIATKTPMRIEIPSAQRHTTARAVEVVSLGGDPETWLLGLELDVPGNFWGIDYAPSDWKIVEFTPEAEPSLDPPPAKDPRPVPSRRWRLTDISEGACYLETSAPLPAGIDVLLSVRAADTEWLLDGIVRVSHPGIGMGVEFTEGSTEETGGAQVNDRRQRVEQLIGRLKNYREIPKIFVGRKEKPKPKSMTSGKNGTSSVDYPPEFRPLGDAGDPLLHLVREGAALTTQQFLNDLRAQRLGKRRDPRVDLVLPVLLTGTDIGGRPLAQQVVTINISRRGALLQGVHGRLKPGDQVFLDRAQNREAFRVAWAGAPDTPKAGQIGVAAVDPNTKFWSELLENGMHSRSGQALAQAHEGASDGPFAG
jgi:hypothetical protein